MPNASSSSNRVRDHLANERTYLAWVRTSIALLGFGVVIVKLRFLAPDSPVSLAAAQIVPAAGQGGRSLLLGLLFCVSGVVTLVFAISTYNRTRRAIDADTYQPSGVMLIVFTALIVVLAVCCIALLLKLG